MVSEIWFASSLRLHAPFVLFNVNVIVLILSENRGREGDLISVGMSKEICI